MQFVAMKRRDLLELCRQHGFATRGSKFVLTGALLVWPPKPLLFWQSCPLQETSDFLTLSVLLYEKKLKKVIFFLKKQNPSHFHLFVNEVVSNRVWIVVSVCNTQSNCLSERARLSPSRLVSYIMYAVMLILIYIICDQNASNMFVLISLRPNVVQEVFL